MHNLVNPLPEDKRSVLALSKPAPAPVCWLFLPRRRRSRASADARPPLKGEEDDVGLLHPSEAVVVHPQAAEAAAAALQRKGPGCTAGGHPHQRMGAKITATVRQTLERSTLRSIINFFDGPVKK